MSEKPTVPLEKGLPRMVPVDGHRAHQGTPDGQADWLSIVDRIREERAQALMCKDVPAQAKG